MRGSYSDDYRTISYNNRKHHASCKEAALTRFIRRRGALVLCLVVALFVGFSSIAMTSRVNASDKATITTKKVYVSYKVKTGDNLNAIAKEYCDLNHYSSYDDFIREVEDINHINADKIVAGHNITIPNYV